MKKKDKKADEFSSPSSLISLQSTIKKKKGAIEHPTIFYFLLILRPFFFFCQNSGSQKRDEIAFGLYTFASFFTFEVYRDSQPLSFRSNKKILTIFMYFVVTLEISLIFYLLPRFIFLRFLF